MKTIKLSGTEKQFKRFCKFPFIIDLYVNTLPPNKKWLMYEYVGIDKRIKIEFTIKNKKKKINNPLPKPSYDIQSIQIKEMTELLKEVVFWFDNYKPISKTFFNAPPEVLKTKIQNYLTDNNL